MSEVLLNKEALTALASSTRFKQFGFLDPVRSGTKVPLNGQEQCSTCLKPKPVLMSDTKQEVVLQSLLSGAAYANEVADLKLALVTQTLVLPLQTGTVRI